MSDEKIKYVPKKPKANLYLPILLLVFTIIAEIGAVLVLDYFGVPPIPQIVIMIIAGVIGLFMILISTTVILSYFGLGDKNEALGLPAGSIRALIALLLIIIFAILGLYLFSELDVETEEISLTTDQYNKIEPEKIYSSEAVYDNDNNIISYETRLIIDNQNSVDYAKQLLTTIRTLVVALAGFYFGTRSVAVARGAVAPLQPTIRKVNKIQDGKNVKAEGKPEETITLEITGENFKNPKAVELRGGDKDPIICTITSSSKTIIRCIATIPKGRKEGEKWDLYVRDEDGGEDTFPEALEITSK